MDSRASPRFLDGYCRDVALRARHAGIRIAEREGDLPWIFALNGVGVRRLQAVTEHVRG